MPTPPKSPAAAARHHFCSGIGEVRWHGGPECPFCGLPGDVRASERERLDWIIRWWRKHPLAGKPLKAP